MMRWAVIFLVVAIVAAIFGFGGIAGTAASAAKIVFVVALILAVVGFLMGRGAGGAVALLLGAGTLLGAAGSARADWLISTQRTGLTLGGAVGGGHIACEGDGCDGVNEAFGLDVHLGGMLTPRLALVADAWGMQHEQDRATFRQGMLTGGLRFWPVGMVWVAAGVGVARTSWEYDAEVVTFESRTENVPAVMGAIGVELISTPKMAVDLALRAGTGFYEEDTRLRNVSVTLGASVF